MSIIFHLYEGCKVTYTDVMSDKKEKGVVKKVDIDSRNVYVVFNCNDDWENYMNYTPLLTPIELLTVGWQEDSHDHIWTTQSKNLIAKWLLDTNKDRYDLYEEIQRWAGDPRNEYLDLTSKRLWDEFKKFNL